MARRALAANCGGSAIFVLGAAAFDGVAFGAPAQDAAGKVGHVAGKVEYVAEASLAQNYGGLCVSGSPSPSFVRGDRQSRSPRFSRISHLLRCSFDDPLGVLFEEKPVLNELAR